MKIVSFQQRARYANSTRPIGAVGGDGDADRRRQRQRQRRRPEPEANAIRVIRK